MRYSYTYITLKNGTEVQAFVDVRGAHPTLFVGLMAFPLDGTVPSNKNIPVWRALMEVPGQPFAGQPMRYN